MISENDLVNMKKRIEKRIRVVQNKYDEVSSHNKSKTRDLLLLNYDDEMTFLFELIERFCGKKTILRKITKKN